MSRRLPCERCVVCDRTFQETGGKRLVATTRYAISVCAAKAPIGAFSHPARTIRLTGDFRDVVVVFSGEKFWTDEIVRRVEAVCLAGTRPWFCQRCAGTSLCPKCCTPFTTAPMTDWMEDNGQVVHSAAFMGFVRQCPNPDCEANRTDVPA